jgi:allantoinase
MPLNSIPPTTTLAGLEAKAAAAEGKLRVDVGFCGGVVPGNADELRPLRAAGVLAFKSFLCDSGVAEFPMAREEDLRGAMPLLADLGAPLFVHAEAPGPLEAAAAALSVGLAADVRRHATWLASRPHAAEDEAIALLVRLSRETRARVHVVHLSSADALAIVRAAKQEGVPLGAETCPHYLHFAAEQIPDGATEHKCAPPIREEANRARLWEGLSAGAIDLVVSDHSPCTPELKRLGGGDFMQAWGGIASVGLVLPVVWTHARARGARIEDLVEWICAAPARLAGLAGRKGAIAAGADADLVVWDPDAPFAVDRTRLGHRHAQSPYHGAMLSGVIEQTWLRGEVIYDASVGEVGSPRGALLRGG